MLRDAHDRGRSDVLRRFGIKTALNGAGLSMGVPMHPALAGMHADLHAAAPHAATPAAPAASWADMHHGVQQQQAANVGAPASMPAPAPAARSLATAAPAAAPRAGGFMRPLKRGLGLAALGAAGATAYGLHQQNEDDRRSNNLVYAPMTGGF